MQTSYRWCASAVYRLGLAVRAWGICNTEGTEGRAQKVRRKPRIRRCSAETPRPTRYERKIVQELGPDIFPIRILEGKSGDGAALRKGHLRRWPLQGKSGRRVKK